jgi:hypothetical protein
MTCETLAGWLQTSRRHPVRSTPDPYYVQNMYAGASWDPPNGPPGPCRLPVLHTECSVHTPYHRGALSLLRKEAD